MGSRELYWAAHNGALEAVNAALHEAQVDPNKPHLVRPKNPTLLPIQSSNAPFSLDAHSFRLTFITVSFCAVHFPVVEPVSNYTAKYFAASRVSWAKQMEDIHGRVTSST